MDGNEALRTVLAHAGVMATVETQCERGYAHLGWLLLEVAQMQYWRVQHETFKDYLRSVALVSKRSPGQLHQYLLTVRDLIDTFKPEQLEAMGISKAIKLRQAKDYAIVLPAVVVDAALDPTVPVKDLKKIISVTLKLPDDEGDWMDCEMEFLVTPEQRMTIEAAIDAALHTDPLTKITISKSAQMLDIMMKFSQEFLGAHCGDGQ